MDEVGNKAARREIAMIKAVVPQMASAKIIDRAKIQAHGGGNVCRIFRSRSFGLRQNFKDWLTDPTKFILDRWRKWSSKKVNIRKVDLVMQIMRFIIVHFKHHRF